MSVEPALTAEEWEAAGIVGTSTARLLCGTQEVVVSEGRASAVAALCLHGRLTWAMVDVLRRVPIDSDNEMPGDADTLDALADLLESLLPPRAP